MYWYLTVQKATMGKNSMEIPKQILALDRITESRTCDRVNPSSLGGPLFLPATWVNNMDVEGLRNALGARARDPDWDASADEAKGEKPLPRRGMITTSGSGKPMSLD